MTSVQPDSVAAVAPKAAAWPFVGRVGELAKLRRALGDGGGAVISGPAGIGKSTLISQAVPRPSARIVATSAGHGIAMWGCEALVGERVHPSDAPNRLRRHLADRHRGPGNPILVVDDIDYLDDETMAVVVHLVAQGLVRLMASRRNTAIPPEPVSALWREAGVQRIDLGPLHEDEVAELLRLSLGGPTDGRSLADLTNMAGGNPLLIRELVEESRSAGTLVSHAGLWCLVDEPALSPDLLDRVASELSGLRSDEREVIELIAFAHELPAVLADHAIDPGVLEALERRRCVTIRGADGAVSLASELVAEATRRELATSTRRRLAGFLATETEGLGWTDPDLDVRTVTWRLQAGAPVDAERTLAAARRALEGGDTALGEMLAAAATSAKPSTQAALLESWCAEELGHSERAEAVLGDHQPVGDEAVMAIAIRRAEQQFWGHHDDRAASSILADAAVAVAAPWSLAATAQQCVFEGLDGHPDFAIEHGLVLVDHETQLVGSTASLAATFSLTVADRASEAKAIAETALLRLSSPTPALFIDPGVHVIGLAFALHGAGELVAADELLAEVYRHTLGRAGRQAQGWAALLRAHVLAARGRPIPAMEAAVEAEQLWVSAGLDGPARWSATVAALALAETADVDELEHALKRVDGYDPVPFRLFEPETARARAWMKFHRSDPEAPAAFAATAALALSTGRMAMAAAAAHDLVRIGKPIDAAQILDRLPPGSTVTDLRRDLAHASETGDRDALSSVADRFEAIGAEGWAAEARALARPFQRVSAALPCAEAERMAGEHGLLTPPIRLLVERPQPNTLTSRETEVVRLAATGLSNRSIADQLVVSLRTVENHLHRSFTKLGVTSRSELTARPRRG